MPSTLTLTVGPVVSTLILNKADTEVAAILRRFIANKAGPMPEGLTPVQANQWRLDQVVAELKRYIVQESTQAHVRELRATANLEVQAEGENNL